jgi:hypothetical protein
MKSAILLELAARWERDARPPQCEDGAPEAQLTNAQYKGERRAKGMCAEDLRVLVRVLGDDEA